MKKTLSSVVDITAKQTHPMRQQLLRPHQAIAERMFAGDEESTTKHFDAEDNIGNLSALCRYLILNTRNFIILMANTIYGDYTGNSRKRPR